MPRASASDRRQRGRPHLSGQPLAGAPAFAASSRRCPELSLWAQDTWHATRRLTVTAGLRWEFSPGVGCHRPALLSTPGDRHVCRSWQPPLWPTSLSRFAPRLGLAFRLRATAGPCCAPEAVSITIPPEHRHRYLNGGPLNVSYIGGRRSFPRNSATASCPISAARWPSGMSPRSALRARRVSLGYVGSAGDDLIRRELGGPGNTPTSWVALTTNNGPPATMRSRRSTGARYRVLRAGVVHLVAFHR